MELVGWLMITIFSHFIEDSGNSMGIEWDDCKTSNYKSFLRNSWAVLWLVEGVAKYKLIYTLQLHCHILRQMFYPTVAKSCLCSFFDIRT